MAKAKGVKVEVSLPVSFLREGKHFIAYTPSLDLSTSALSYDKAKKRFGEIVQIFFEELLEKGTLDEVLTGLGWRKVRKRWSPPVLIAQESESIKIPLSA